MFTVLVLPVVSIASLVFALGYVYLYRSRTRASNTGTHVAFAGI